MPGTRKKAIIQFDRVTPVIGNSLRNQSPKFINSKNTFRSCIRGTTGLTSKASGTSA